MVVQSPAPPCADDSLVECALKILQCPDPWKKADYTYATVKMWRDGTIKRVRPVVFEHLAAPDRPARSDDKVKVCSPGEAPRRGKGGTLASRQALLHSAVHIENWAVDLSWDIIARFGLRAHEYGLPRSFFDDFVTVAEDECRHFSALAKRLEETGSYYGAFAVHDGLWESASNTSHSLPARLAVEHCVHEARGLDVLPSTIAKFANNGDSQSAALLRDVIYPEEVSHCAAGVRWIRYLYDVAHGRRPVADPADGDNAADGLHEQTNGYMAAAAAHGANGDGAAVPPAAAAAAAAGEAAASRLAMSLAEALRLEASCSRPDGTSPAAAPRGADGEGQAAAAAVAAPAAAAPQQQNGGSVAVPKGAPGSGVGDGVVAAAAGTSAAGRDVARDCSADGVSGGSGADGGCGKEAGVEGGAVLPSWVLDARKYGSVEEWFHSLVRAHFWGALKPPFNEEARVKAGFGPEWYLPLAVPAANPQAQQPAATPAAGPPEAPAAGEPAAAAASKASATA